MLPCAFPAEKCFPACSCFPIALRIGTSAGSCFPMPLASLSEHKIGIFVRFCPPKPPFSAFPSTKSRFLCQKGQFSPGFTPFRAQNRHFCALLAFRTLIFGLFEHKIGFFVSKWAIFPRFWVVLTQNRHFCARGWLPRVQQCPLKPSRAHRSSAPPATSPAGCILQQCARQ